MKRKVHYKSNLFLELFNDRETKGETREGYTVEELSSILNSVTMD